MRWVARLCSVAVCGARAAGACRWSGFLRSTSLARSNPLADGIPPGPEGSGLHRGPKRCCRVSLGRRPIDDRLPALIAESDPPIGGRDRCEQQYRRWLAKTATTTIPIVFATGGDPVRNGLVASLNRPGGNVTGVAFLAQTIWGETAGATAPTRYPKATTIGGVWGSRTPTEYRLGVQRRARRQRRHRAATHCSVKSATYGDIEAAFATSCRARVPAHCSLGSGPFFLTQRGQLVALAARHALPAIYDQREQVEAGGLMSYGTSHDRCLSPSRHLRRPDSQGREAGRPAGHSSPASSSLSST